MSRTALVAAATLLGLLVPGAALACGVPSFLQRSSDGLYVNAGAKARNDVRVAELYLKQGRAEEALLLAQAALTLELRRDLERLTLEEAAATPQLALAAGERPRAERIAGLAALQLGKHEVALSHLERADRSPRSVEGRATALVALSRPAEAVALLRPLVESESLTPAGALALARGEQALGHFGAARDSLRVALRLDPENEAVRALDGELRLRPVTATSTATASAAASPLARMP